MNKIIKILLFICFMLYNIPFWILFNIMGDDNFWELSWNAYRKMIRGKGFYE
jgi:hypothetical protein